MVGIPFFILSADLNIALDGTDGKDQLSIASPKSLVAIFREDLRSCAVLWQMGCDWRGQGGFESRAPGVREGWPFPFTAM